MATGPLTELLCLSKHFVQLAFLLSHALKQVPSSTLSFSRKLRIPTKSLLQQFLELPRPVYSLCVVVSSNVLSSNKHIGDHTLSSLSIQLVLDCVPIRNLIQLNHHSVDVPHVPEKSLGLSAVGTKRFTKDATFWRQPLRLFRVPTGLNLRRGQTRSDGDSHCQRPHRRRRRRRRRVRTLLQEALVPATRVRLLFESMLGPDTSIEQMQLILQSPYFLSSETSTHLRFGDSMLPE